LPFCTSFSANGFAPKYTLQCQSKLEVDLKIHPKEEKNERINIPVPVSNMKIKEGFSTFHILEGHRHPGTICKGKLEKSGNNVFTLYFGPSFSFKIKFEKINFFTLYM
jgi:hypothetical protein